MLLWKSMHNPSTCAKNIKIFQTIFSWKSREKRITRLRNLLLRKKEICWPIIGRWAKRLHGQIQSVRIAEKGFGAVG